MRDIFESAIGRIFGDLVTPELIQRCAEGYWPEELWRAIEDAEMTSAALPESLGGAGAPWDDIYVLVRAAGAHAVPAPFADTLLANWLLGRAGMQPVKGPIATAAHSTLSYADGHASGLLTKVPWGRDVRYVAAISTGTKPFVVVLEMAKASRIDSKRNMAGEPRDDIRFEHARVVEAARLPEDLTPELLLLGGAMLRSGQIAGALQSLLHMTVTYATQRVQFGKPIGHFQVIQQQIAQLAEHSASSLVAAEAAFAEAGTDFPALPVMAAKICTGEAASIGASIAHAVHGAIGFTDEHSLHLKTRRLWAWRAEYGSQSYWSQRLGVQVCASGSQALWPMLTQPTLLANVAAMESRS
jgi:acyl-CoA dehydrogenase